MTSQIAIRYQSGVDTYKVVLTAASKQVFYDVAQEHRLLTEEGENLVAEFLKHARGPISSVERFKNDLPHNGANGEPALEKYNGMGVTTTVMRARDGKMNDGDRGEPAFLEYNEDGGLTLIGHFKAGKLHDSAEGEPAIQKFDGHGARLVAIHYDNGKEVSSRAQSTPLPVAP